METKTRKQKDSKENLKQTVIRNMLGMCINWRNQFRFSKFLIFHIEEVEMRKTCSESLRKFVSERKKQRKNEQKQKQAEKDTKGRKWEELKMMKWQKFSVILTEKSKQYKIK